MTNLALSKRLLALSGDDFIELLETGTLYKLYPELKGELFNIGQFLEAKEQYETRLKAEQAAEQFLYSICEFTGSDPADIYDLLVEHQEDIILMLEAEELELEDVFHRVRGG